MEVDPAAEVIQLNVTITSTTVKLSIL